MSVITKETQLQKLVDIFKVSLDEALVVAIANDYDLQDPSAYDSAHASLNSLAQDALAEEATGFNPSGVSGPPDGLDPAVAGDETDDSSLISKGASQQASQTQNTESSNTDSSPHTSDSVYVIPRLTSFSEDSDEGKLAQLQSLFPDIKPFDLKFALNKANGDFQNALDDLLNLQDLQSSGQLPKGIDGFFVADEPASGKKKGKRHGRGKTLKTLESTVPSIEYVSSDHPNVAKHQEETSYIADSLGLDYNMVSQVYTRKKYSIGATVAEILEGYIMAGIMPEDETSKQQAQELAQKYRNIPEHYIPTLVHLTPFPRDAEGLAVHLTKHFAKNPWTQKLDLNYSLTSLPHDDIEGSTSGIAGKTTSQKSKLTDRLDLPPISTTAPRNLAQVLQARDVHSQARRDASASAAKLAKSSSPLMRQGAGFYAERAREHGRNAWQATSEAADIHVEHNSTQNTIDLHGVSVQDGVRIARQRTHDWWQNLGEYKTSKAKAEPYTVVTGIGRHSAGGISQMRKAVAAALIQDGWKMQIEGGKFVITGRR